MTFFQVELLLKYGADVNKKTATSVTCLYLAIDNEDLTMVDLLLKKGAEVNKEIFLGTTVTHYTSMRHKSSILRNLLKHNADLNMIDNTGHTPLTCASNFEKRKILVQELAKLKFQNHRICDENLEFIQTDDKLNEIFGVCLDELGRMKNHVILNGFSLYNIFRGRQSCKRLIFLTRNKKFVAKFKSGWSRRSFKNYRKDLDSIVQEAQRRNNVLRTEEKKLSLILKNHLPDLVIRKIAYFSNEHLFFK